MKTTFLLDTKFFPFLRYCVWNEKWWKRTVNGIAFLVKIKGYGLTFGRNRAGCLAAAERESSSDAEPVGVSRSLFDKLHVFFFPIFSPVTLLLYLASSCFKRFLSLRKFFDRGFARLASREFFAFFGTALKNG